MHTLTAYLDQPRLRCVCLHAARPVSGWPLKDCSYSPARICSRRRPISIAALRRRQLDSCPESYPRGHARTDLLSGVSRAGHRRENLSTRCSIASRFAYRFFASMPWIQGMRRPTPPCLTKFLSFAGMKRSRVPRKVRIGFRRRPWRRTPARSCTPSFCTTFTLEPYKRPREANTRTTRPSIGDMRQTQPGSGPDFHLRRFDAIRGNSPARPPGAHARDSRTGPPSRMPSQHDRVSARCHVLVERRGSRTPSRRRVSEIRAFARCRNERLRLPAFLRALPRARRGPLLHRRQRFVRRHHGLSGGAARRSSVSDRQSVQRGRSGTAWLNALLAEFGVGFWCVTVDIDELLVFPGSERIAAYADCLSRRRGHDALVCLLLDMYPGTPLDESSLRRRRRPARSGALFRRGTYEHGAVRRYVPGFSSWAACGSECFTRSSERAALGARCITRYSTACCFERRSSATFVDSRLRPAEPTCLRKCPWFGGMPTQIPQKHARRFPEDRRAGDRSPAALQATARLSRKARRGGCAGEYSTERPSTGAMPRRSTNPRMTFMYEGSMRFEGTSNSYAWASCRTARPGLKLAHRLSA